VATAAARPPVDPMDLVRDCYRAVNRSDPAAVAACYHPDCILEQVFDDDDGVCEGRERVRMKFADEFERFAGALPGGGRVQVRRVAGIETGWGWVQADWTSARRDVATGREDHTAGSSHFWIEDGLIRRHRTVRMPEAAVTTTADAGTAVPAGRRYPARPVVGIGAVVVDEDGRVVLVKRRHEPLAGQWSLPGGALEVGETLEAGTAREVLEETGLVVDVGPVVEVFDRILLDAAGATRFHFVLVDYLARPRGGALRAGGDVTDATLADPRNLAGYRLTEKTIAVIERALAELGSWPP
jgi:8-oxo-dGTP diphosphatase